VWLLKTFTFESAHFLPNVPEEHKCKRLHGHSFKATVTIQGPLDPRFGWVMDYGDIKKMVDPFIDALDHRLLNDIPGLENPTSENIALWLWNKLKSPLPLLESIEIQETCVSGCVYRGPQK
jgi:6-pyruvoyltetrahydropterin/6-carboxytetrahydropterin synthase